MRGDETRALLRKGGEGGSQNGKGEQGGREKAYNQDARACPPQGGAAHGPYGRDSITPLAVKTMNYLAGQLSPSIESEGRKL